MTGPSFDRRTLLLGAASAAFLVACGGSDDTGAPATTTASTGSTGPAARFSLVSLFDPNQLLVTGSPQRAPLALGDGQGVLVHDPPASIDFELSLDGAPVGDPITVPSHAEGLPRAYFPLGFTPTGAGLYTATTTIDGESLETTFTVSDPSAVPVPGAGDPMPSVDTPTTADGHGVDPICTREPPCPLHEVSLKDGLGEGRPIAFLISTPKYCQVAICGPVLDVLLSRQTAYPGVRMIHAEVWTDDTTSTLAPAVQAFSITYEPVLFLADSAGRIQSRLDSIYDSTELDVALADLTG
jgi:hypothetical protein